MVGAWQGRDIPRFGTTKASPGQGRQDGREKLGIGSERHGFSLFAGLGSLPLFSLGFGRLSFFMFVFESHMRDMCLFR